jgi:hypothetical protein
MRRSIAMEFLRGKIGNWGDECYPLPKPQKNILLVNKSRSVGWVVCKLAHGDPPEGGVAINVCGAWDCANGTHWRWGTFAESLAQRSFTSRRGERNPAAKLTALDVAQLRSVNWERGTYKAITAEHLGISLATLHKILNGWTWKGIEPYRSVVPTPSRPMKPRVTQSAEEQ